jgi:hypothetical protein
MMIGPQRVPLVHNGVFGQVRLLPEIKRPAPRLGEPPGPTMPAEEIDYNKAYQYLDGIRKNFEGLVALIGPSAEKALEQAKQAYEEALKTKNGTRV